VQYFQVSDAIGLLAPFLPTVPGLIQSWSSCASSSSASPFWSPSSSSSSPPGPKRQRNAVEEITAAGESFRAQRNRGLPARVAEFRSCQALTRQEPGAYSPNTPAFWHSRHKMSGYRLHGSARAGPYITRISTSPYIVLILGGLLHMIDDEDFDGTPVRFEPQPELFLCGGKHRRTARVSRGAECIYVSWPRDPVLQP
jgi:hypothetical protein